MGDLLADLPRTADWADWWELVDQRATVTPTIEAAVLKSALARLDNVQNPLIPVLREAEVETVVARHPAVSEVAVTGLPATALTLAELIEFCPRENLAPIQDPRAARAGGRAAAQRDGHGRSEPPAAQQEKGGSTWKPRISF